MNIAKKIINVLTTLIIAIGGIILALYIFRIVPYVILSGSMEPKIKTGSLCFINKKTSIKDIKEKDIIAFKLNDGTLVTHRVKDITKDGIITKGDNNKRADSSLVTEHNFVGKNIFWIPKLGYAVVAFQSKRGKIVLLISVIVLFTIGLLFGSNSKKEEK